MYYFAAIFILVNCVLQASAVSLRVCYTPQGGTQVQHTFEWGHFEWPTNSQPSEMAIFFVEWSKFKTAFEKLGTKLNFEAPLKEQGAWKVTVFYAVTEKTLEDPEVYGDMYATPIDANSDTTGLVVRTNIKSFKERLDRSTPSEAAGKGRFFFMKGTGNEIPTPE